MEYEELSDGLLEVVEPITAGMGFKIVFLKSWTKRERLHLSLTLHRPEGVSLEDCAAVYRTIMPRICVHADAADPHIEISSPGVGRILKNAREFGVFEGSPVLILSRGKDDWTEGVIQSASSASVSVAVDGGVREFQYGDIVKAKLG